MENIELKNLLLQLSGTFYDDGGDSFFIITEAGNFVWSDPAHGGNNTIKKVSFSLENWMIENQIPNNLHQHTGLIRTVCGEDFEVVT